MKTNTNHPLAKVAKIAAIMSMSALLMTSCGKKNQSDSNAVTGQSPVFSNPQQQADYNSLKSQYTCDGGEQRLGDIPLSLVNGGNQGGTLNGQLQNGHVGGAPTETFVGINYGFKDLLIITKVSNGGQVSYNFTLSLCSKRGQSGMWFIGGDAQLSNFQANAVLPVSSINCSFGNVVNGNIAFSNSNFGQDGRSFTQVCWQ
ncbi:MAG: hypothetical protein HN576_04410 [Bacteriovoracaceae bacterium]|jgi:hypothetical protein|nr:hypothetical protein [Bacteriovoracaceae bacterium]